MYTILYCRASNELALFKVWGARAVQFQMVACFSAPALATVLVPVLLDDPRAYSVHSRRSLWHVARRSGTYGQTALGYLMMFVNRKRTRSHLLHKNKDWLFVTPSRSFYCSTSVSAASYSEIMVPQGARSVANCQHTHARHKLQKQGASCNQHSKHLTLPCAWYCTRPSMCAPSASSRGSKLSRSTTSSSSCGA